MTRERNIIDPDDPFWAFDEDEQLGDHSPSPNGWPGIRPRLMPRDCIKVVCDGRTRLDGAATHEPTAVAVLQHREMKHNAGWGWHPIGADYKRGYVARSTTHGAMKWRIACQVCGITIDKRRAEFWEALDRFWGDAERLGLGRDDATGWLIVHVRALGVIVGAVR